ncbi:hypothetical protein [Autumnicola tepida]
MHENGLSIAKASGLLLYFIKESFRRKISGVKLKSSSNQLE